MSLAKNFITIPFSRASSNTPAPGFRRGGREDYRLEAGLLLFEIDSTAQRLHEAIEVLWSLEAQYTNDPDVLYAAYRLHADLCAKSLAGLMKVEPDSARLDKVTSALL